MRAASLCLTLLLAAAAAAAPATIVTVGAEIPGVAAVAPNFCGLSIEVGAVLKMLGPTGESAPLATLLRHLHALTAGAHAGPTLRLGGNSADDSAWLGAAPVKPLPAGISYQILPADLAAYTTFAAKTAAAANVSIIIDTVRVRESSRDREC